MVLSIGEKFFSLQQKTYYYVDTTSYTREAERGGTSGRTAKLSYSPLRLLTVARRSLRGVFLPPLQLDEETSGRVLLLLLLPLL